MDMEELFKNNLVIFLFEKIIAYRKMQVKHYLKESEINYHGIYIFDSNEELTIWTPLVDCIDENTPRLLLTDKDTLTLESILDNDDYFFDNGVKYLSNIFKPFAYQNESEFSHHRKKNKPYI